MTDQFLEIHRKVCPRGLMYLKVAKGTGQKDLQIFDHRTGHGDHQGDVGLQKLPKGILSQFPDAGLGH